MAYERLASGELGRYRRVKRLEFRESFEIMRDFAASLSESRQREQLLDALARNKPFRHFKALVHSDLSLREQWFAFRDDAQAQYVRDWLKSEGIGAELLCRRRAH